MTAIRILAFGLLGASLVEPAACDAGLYKPLPGPLHMVERETLVLHDDARDVDLPLRVSFPREDGRYPLIIFSHGLFGSKDAYQPLVEHWVSHGYVVIRPTHGDSLSLLSEKQRRRLRGRSLGRLARSRRFTQYWDDRVYDVRLLLDSLDQIEQQVHGLAGRIDRTRIAHGGHSFGAHTSMLLAGLTLYAPSGRSLQLADDRLHGFVFISPQGPGRTVRPESYHTIRGPVLMITGSNDSSPVAAPNQPPHDARWRLQAWENLPDGPDRYLLFIEGAYHGFGGITGHQPWPGSGPLDEDQVRYVKTTTLAFWDACLKDDPQARRYLRSGTIEAASDGEAKISRKAK